MTVEQRGREEDESRRDIEDLAGGALVNFVGKLGRLSRGAFIWVLTLLFGLEVQGLYSLAWGIVSTVNKIGLFGMQRGVMRFVVEARAAGDEEKAEGAIAAGLGIGVSASAAIAAVTMLSADWLAIFYDKDIGSALRIMAWSMPFMIAAWIFLAATMALRIMRYDVYVVSIASPLFLLVGGLVAGFMAMGLESVAWIQFTMAVGSCLLAIHYFRHFFSLMGCFRQLGRKPPWKPLARFSFPVMLADLLYSILTQLDVLMLGFFVGGEMVGLYALARRLASSMLKAPQALDPILSSIVSELSYQRRHQELDYRISVISRWILTVNLPLFAGILIVGDNLLPMLVQGNALSLAQVEAGIRVLSLLCIGMMLQSIFAVAEPLLAMSGRPYLNLFNNTLWLAANGSLNMWLIPSHGIVGAAWGAFLSMALVNIIRLLQVYLIHGVQPFRRSLVKPLLAALCSALVGWLVLERVPFGMFWGTIALVVTFLGPYLFLLGLLGLEAEDRALLERFGRKVRSILSSRDV